MDCVVTPLKTLMGFSVYLNVQLKFYNLPDIKTNIEQHGSFSIVANRGFWKLNSSGKIEYGELLTSFPGTLIKINFDLTQPYQESQNSLQDSLQF